MKIPSQNDYKHYTSFRDASLRYDITRAVGSTIKTEEYNFLGHGFQPKNCFLYSELTRLVNMQSNTPYFMGIELEVEGVIDRNRSRFSDILQKYLAKSHKVVRDGSLSDSGAEIVTIPLSKIDRIQWYYLLKDLRSIGVTSHNNNRCGLHIHISRAYLHDAKWKMLQSFIFLNQVKFKKLSRRDMFSYCQFYDAGKYTALNLTKESTCEFRFFRGTLNARSFLASIDICRSLVEYAYKSENLSWLAWCEELKNIYPLAHSYLEGKLEDSIREAEIVLTPPRRQRRPRRSLDEQRRDLFARYNCLYGGYELTMASNRLILRPYLSQADGRYENVVADLTSLPYSLRLKHRRLFGHYVQVFVATGTVISPNETVRFSYHASGWGNRSRIWVLRPSTELQNNLTQTGE
jgi:hypothetical protein